MKGNNNPATICLHFRVQREQAHAALKMGYDPNCSACTVLIDEVSLDAKANRSEEWIQENLQDNLCNNENFLDTVSGSSRVKHSTSNVECVCGVVVCVCVVLQSSAVVAVAAS